MPSSLTPLQRRIAAPAVATLAAILLAACNAAIPKDPASPYYQVSVGSILKLQHKVEIPPGKARVFIQDGAIAANFDHYAPNCNVEVDQLDHDRVQYVEPGEYRIRRVQLSIEEIVQSRRVQLAALGTGPWLAKADGGDGNAMIYKGYHLWVEDPTDNFTRLSCRGAYADPWDARPPSINEMHQALGDIGSLQLLNAPAN